MPSNPASSLRTSAASSSLSWRNLLASCSMDLSIETDTVSSALPASASRLTGSLISCAHAGSMAAANAIVAIFICFPPRKQIRSMPAAGRHYLAGVGRDSSPAADVHVGLLQTSPPAPHGLAAQARAALVWDRTDRRWPRL